MAKRPAVPKDYTTTVKTGAKYPALQEHLASWGFITIATEEEHAWNGFSAEMCVRYLERLNTYKGDVTKVLARRNDADHGEMLYYGDGYVTAWFMYYLQDGTEAGKAFAIGGEMESNSLYRDVKTNIIK